MRSAPLHLFAVAAGLLLVTACGQEAATSSAPAAGPSSRPSDDAVCGAAGRSPRPTTAPSSPQAETDGVRVIRVVGEGGGRGGENDDTDGGDDGGQGTGGVKAETLPTSRPHGCVVYQVTNRHAEAYRYTITFSFLSDTGAAQATADTVVASVEPGRTVAGTVDADDQPPGVADWSQVKVMKVRSVPTDQAPVEGGPCPASGVQLYADKGDAAMGLRMVTLHLVNCATTTYRIEGYPRLTVLDESRRAVAGVRVLHDGSSVTTGTGADGPAEPLALEPGQSAHAGLVWRNTVLAGTAVNAPYAKVWAKPGAAPVIVTPELDLGTTGRLAVGPWKRDT